jgi:glycogen debranching enzyme
MPTSSLVRLRGRPDTLYLSHNRSVLATDRHGFIAEGSSHGLFAHETRVLSTYRLLVDGVAPQPNALSNVEQGSWLGYYILPVPGAPVTEPDTGSGQLQDASQQALEIRISRVLKDGLHEDIDITNFSQYQTSFQLEIALDADFADLAETTGRRQQQGTLHRQVRLLSKNSCELAFSYRIDREYHVQNEIGVAHLDRGITMAFTNTASPPTVADNGVRFSIALAPHEQWHGCLLLTPEIEGTALAPPAACRALIGPLSGGAPSDFLARSTKFSSPASGTLAPVVVRALEQARYDLEALRLRDLDHGPDAWTLAAGLPMYVALFGRDSLTAGWQAAITGPEMMRGTLLELERWQGKQVNDWRDEQPGRMLHEAHDGPLSMLNFNSHGRSYGSVTTAALYPFVLAELWHWTGDRDLVRSLVPAARAGLRWLDDWSHHSSHGFYDYLTRSKDGVQNQAWKDSGDAIVDQSGGQVRPPIATCEEQGFAYVSKQFLAEVLWWLDERHEAKRLRHEANDLKRRFNDAYWIDELDFVALGLDHDGRQIRSITSNAGHCIAAGILDDERIPKVADRLMREDLFSGWGIRTLSARHPAYNPYSYHRGSVWPVEQGTFVLGFVRYGLHAQANRLARAVFESASLFEACRLPELIGGHHRDDDHPFPGMYPQANSPQAWSSSAVFLIVQSLLGLYPYAPLNLLLVDPQLPDWLPQITVRELRVGRSRVSIRFFRTKDGKSSYRVLDLEGKLHVVHQPSPWSLTTSFGERLRDLVGSVAR